MRTNNNKTFNFQSIFNIGKKVFKNPNASKEENVISENSLLSTVKETNNLSELPEQVDYRIVSARYLLENDIIEIPMLWGHLLQKCGIAVLSGSSDTGKSTLLRQLAIAIVTEQERFLGLSLKPTHHRVIYISTEDDEESLSPRIKKEHRKDTIIADYDNLTFIIDGEFEIAKNEFKKKPADCIIIDTWGDYAEGDLNSANNVRTPLKALRSFDLTNKCLFIINHQNRKSASDYDISKKNLLGSQSLEAKARVVLMLTIDNDDPTLRKLSVSKGNYIPYKLKQRSIIIRTNEDFIFEYLSEVENPISKGKESDKRHDENLAAVETLLAKGKKPTEIIAEIPSIVKNPFKKSALRKIIKEISDESASTLL